MKYCVYVTELRYGSVHIEADSDDEAVQKAHTLYDHGQVVWHDGELEDLTPKEDRVCAGR